MAERKGERGEMTSWIVTDAQILENGQSLKVTFKRVGDRIGQQTITMDADAWCDNIHQSYLVQEERKVVAHLGKLLKDEQTEKWNLKYQLVRESKP